MEVSLEHLSAMLTDAHISIAFDYPGVQFYPSCIQFKITGSGSAFPTELVSFPGAYTVDTPGIVFNVYGGATVSPSVYSVSLLCCS